MVANILANPLRLLAPLLAARVRAGGHIVLSGILEPQAAAVIGGVRAMVYYRRLEAAMKDGWRCAGMRATSMSDG